MSRKIFNLSLGIIAVFCGIVVTPIAFADNITPETLTATLRPGQCVNELKTVVLTGSPANVDIMFSFDLTGSMSGIINTAKAQAIEIINAVRLALPDSSIRFGVVSYMDYNGYYSSCGYADSYGSGSDYPYMLDQSLTLDEIAVSNAINALVQGGGDDGPQDYSRIFYESVEDSGNIGWGEGVKFMINFGDNVPHSCNIYEGTPLCPDPSDPSCSVYSTGADPGRDGIVGTADDVVLLDALNQMAANKIILYEFHTYDAGELWDFWTGITGGGVYITGSSGSDLINQIVAAVEATTKSFDTLTLNASAGFEAWLASVEPPQYSSIEVPEEGISFDFDISVCVPAGACVEGINTFTINALGDGLTLAQQNVTINTVCEIKVPVDIKPGSCPNPIKLKETGLMPFAIMGTVEFDVAQIDPASIRLSREGLPVEVAPIRWSYYDTGIPYEDFDPQLCNCVGAYFDGIKDLALKFDVQSVVKTLKLAEVAGQTIPLTMTGKLKEEFGGTPITGQDCVWVLRK